jgi:predicted metal-dependent RNase
MATGGRVLHHLGTLPDPRNTIFLLGFQAVGTARPPAR